MGRVRPETQRLMECTACSHRVWRTWADVRIDGSTGFGVCPSCRGDLRFYVRVREERRIAKARRDLIDFGLYPAPTPS